MTDAERLEALINAGHALIHIPGHEEHYALELIRGLAIGQNRPLWIWSVSLGVHEGLFADAQPVAKTEDPVAGWQALAERERNPLLVALDAAVHLVQPRALRVMRDMPARLERTGGQLLLVDHEDNLPPVIHTVAARFDVSLPDDEELTDVVRNTLRELHREEPIDVDISRAQFDAVVKNLGGLTRRQAARIIRDAVCHDRRFDDADLDAVLAAKRQALAGEGLLEFVTAPAALDEIGGLKRLKAWLEQRRLSLSTDAAKFGVEAPRGVLMLGVQGAGKSLCAKAISTAWRRPLLRLDVGALYDRYVGESERRLRAALRQAEAMAPIVLWIDEIEKAFASAASQSTDGGLSRRMFGSLLTWMQEHQRPVFLVATANDIEALPPELLRKGRFDEIFFVDLPERDVRREIFAIHLRKRARDPGRFDLDVLADAADGFSGAEIEQAIRSALHEAFGTQSKLDTALLKRVLENSPPLSVTMAEKVAELRAWAAGRCSGAD